VRLDLRVVPRAPRTEVGGLRDGRLLVRVTAPPVDDAANDAVIRALADALDVPRQAIRITAGAASRNKTVEISGVDAAAQARLAGLSARRV
jgi:uncharacterized protein YggU (UPF0235/DUF167 family)